MPPATGYARGSRSTAARRRMRGGVVPGDTEPMSTSIRPHGSRGALRMIVGGLTDSYRHGSPIARMAYLVSAVLIASGLFHAGVLLVTGGSWEGPVSWRKPTTFGLSFGLTLATITWVLNFLPVRRRFRDGLVAVFGVACVMEVVMIAAATWRGLPSHFSDEPGSPIWSLMAALGGVTIVITMLVASIATWRRQPDAAPSMRLALRAGFASLLIALALGVLMLARGMVIARGYGDIPGAFEFTAGIKPGHAATMHGVLVLPALAWLLRFTTRDEAFRLSMVRLACLGYGLFAAVVVAEVLSGVDPVAGPIAASVFAACGALALCAAGVAAVHAVWTRPVAEPAELAAL